MNREEFELILTHHLDVRERTNQKGYWCDEWDLSCTTTLQLIDHLRERIEQLEKLDEEDDDPFAGPLDLDDVLKIAGLRRIVMNEELIEELDSIYREMSKTKVRDRTIKVTVNWTGICDELKEYLSCKIEYFEEICWSDLLNHIDGFFKQREQDENTNT